MITLYEAQKHARVNKLAHYYRIDFYHPDRGGWWSDINPRQQFFFDQDKLLAEVFRCVKQGREFKFSKLITDQTSDSPNAR